jgi:glycogen(starch) synthase
VPSPLGIALVSREYPPFFGGGIGTYARHIAPALAAAGCRVHVITQAYDATHGRFSRHLAGEKGGSLAVHRIPLIGSAACWTGAMARFAVAAARKVAELAEDGLIDVAEFAECEAAGVALTAARAAGLGEDGVGVPVVVHLHTPTELLYALRSVAPGPMTGTFAAYLLAERASMLAADRLCAPSAFIADWAVAHYGLSERPCVIPYAIEGLPPLPPVPTHRRVLYVGRIEPRKGVEPLIRAWPRVVREHPQWRLRMVGADTSTAPGGVSMRGYLTDLLPPEVRDTVQFVGALPPQMLASEYAEAAVCTVPSLWENFPNTCIEAMSHARPVLVSDAGGMAEMIGDTVAGVTFRSGDVDDLAQVMTSLLSESESALRERGRVARERIAALCDRTSVVSRRLDLYHETIERGRSRPAAARQREGVLGLWRLFQDVAGGDLSRVGLPRLDPMVEQWIADAPERAVAAVAVGGAT